MGGGGVRKLPVFLDPLELIQQVEAETPRVTLAGQQGSASANHEGKTRNAFDALVRRGNQEIYSRVREMDRNSAEAAHGIDHVGPTLAFDHAAGFGNWVEEAGGGLAVNHSDVGDGWVVG